MPAKVASSFEPEVRLAMLRKRIALCRKVLSRLHNTYLEEMKQTQARLEATSGNRRNGRFRSVNS
jgi:hypothetical protein